MEKEGHDKPTGVTEPADDLNDTGIQEDQVGDTTGDVVFKTEDIGNKATSEVFSNVKGGNKAKNKDAEKIEKRRTRVTRKTLFTIFGTLIGLILTIMVIFVILNLINPQGKKYTREDFPEDMNELQEKAYGIAFENENKVSFANAVEYIDYAIENTNDEDRQFELKTFHARMMYYAGYEYAAEKEIESLEDDANTDHRKYLLYTQAAFIYYHAGDNSKALEYNEKANALDVPENQGEWPGEDDGDE